MMLPLILDICVCPVAHATCVLALFLDSGKDFTAEIKAEPSVKRLFASLTDRSLHAANTEYVGFLIERSTCRKIVLETKWGFMTVRCGT